MGGCVKVLDGSAEKRCRKCGEMKPVTEFYKNGRENGRMARCKICTYGQRKPYVREKLDTAYTPLTDGCWIWSLAKDSSGYGVMQNDDGKLIRAHVKFYTMQYGPIPEGMEIDHLCRVPSCVNPLHLEAVTHRENARRGLAGHHMKTRTDFSFLKRS